MEAAVPSREELPSASLDPETDTEVGLLGQDKAELEFKDEEPERPDSAKVKRTFEISERHITMASTSIVSQIPKLKGASNFDAWYSGLKGVAKVNGAWKVLIGTVGRPKPGLASYDEELERWEQIQEKMDGIIRLSVEAGPLSHIAAFEDATSMLKKLEEQYKVKGYTARDIVWRKLTRSNLSEFHSVAQYGETIKKAKTQLEEMGHRADDWMITTSFLHGLGEKYEDFVTMILSVRGKDENGHPLEPDLDSIMEQLMDKERRQKENGQIDSSTKALLAGGKGDSKGAGNWRSSPKAPHGERCSFCHSPRHRDDKCWFKHLDQADEDWKEKHKARIEQIRREAVEKTGSKSLLVKAAKAVSIASEKDDCWYLDSAASMHMTHDRGLYTDTLDETTTTIALADGSSILASGVGKVALNLLIDGADIHTVLYDVYYCPELESNLISLGTLEQNGCSYTARNGLLQVFRSNMETALEATRVGTLYVARLGTQASSNTASESRITCKAATMDLWHQRLAHLNERDVTRLQEKAEGMTILPEPNRPARCEACVLGKQHKQPSRQPQEHRAWKRGQRLHADLGGGGASLSVGGNRYFIILTDDFTRWRWMFPLRTKDEALSKVKEVVNALRNQGLSVEDFRSDDGGEFRGMLPYFKEQGIQWEMSAPKAPEQNGVAERSNRTILEKARTMLIHANLSKAHWAEALNTAIYLANRTPTSSLPDHKTPYEAWHGRIPDVEHLRVFGCRAWVVDHKPKGKMDPRGWKGTFMGYGNGKNQYRVWNGRTVLIRRDVVFDETVNGNNPLTVEENRTNIEEVGVQLGLSLEWEKGFTEIPSTAQLRNGDRSEDAATMNRSVRTDPTTTHVISPEPEGNGDTHEQSSQPEGNEDIDSLSPQPDGNGDTQGMGDTGSDSDNESLLSTIVVDTSNVRSGTHLETPAEAPRRTGRITERHDYEQAHRRGFARTAQVKALEDDDPKSYEIAMSSHDQRKWRQAMEEELNSHQENETWTVVPRPPNRRVLGGRWVFKTKTGLDGKIVRHKARWVVRGFEQIEGIDHDETYAAVVKPATCKVLFALAAAKGLKIEQMDVVTAFLYGTIDEEVYVELPRGEERRGREDSVCRNEYIVIAHLHLLIGLSSTITINAYLHSLASPFNLQHIKRGDV